MNPLILLLEKVRTALIPTLIGMMFAIKSVNTGRIEDEWAAHYAVAALPFLIVSWLLENVPFKNQVRWRKGRFAAVFAGGALGVGAITYFLATLGPGNLPFGLASINLVLILSALAAWGLVHWVGKTDDHAAAPPTQADDAPGRA